MRLWDAFFADSIEKEDGFSIVDPKTGVEGVVLHVGLQPLGERSRRRIARVQETTHDRQEFLNDWILDRRHMYQDVRPDPPWWSTRAAGCTPSSCA